MNDKTQTGQPLAARSIRTGNTARQVRNHIEDTQMILEYRNSQMPGESLVSFLARQKRNSVTTAKALGRDSHIVQAETILLGRVQS